VFAPDPYLFHFTYTLLFTLIFEAHTYGIKEGLYAEQGLPPPRALEALT